MDNLFATLVSVLCIAYGYSWYNSKNEREHQKRIDEERIKKIINKVNSQDISDTVDSLNKRLR